MLQEEGGGVTKNDVLCEGRCEILVYLDRNSLDRVLLNWVSDDVTCVVQ